MRIPLWIGGPALLALAALDAALVIQARSVGSLMRALMRGMGTDLPEPSSYDTVTRCSAHRPEVDEVVATPS